MTRWASNSVLTTLTKSLEDLFDSEPTDPEKPLMFVAEPRGAVVLLGAARLTVATQPGKQNSSEDLSAAVRGYAVDEAGIRMPPKDRGPNNMEGVGGQEKLLTASDLVSPSDTEGEIMLKMDLRGRTRRWQWEHVSDRAQWKHAVVYSFPLMKEVSLWSSC